METTTEKKRRMRALPWDGKEFIAWDGEGTRPKEAEVVNPSLKEIFEWGLTTGLNTSPQNIQQEAPWLLEPHTLEVPEPQPYVLLANSKGDRITRQEGLHTLHCLQFITDTKRQYPNSIFVGFGFKYDVAQILADLPEHKLERIWSTNVCNYRGFRLEYRPGKWFRCTHKASRRTATIFDVFGFFQSSFIVACEKYLGVSDVGLDLIRRGKESRDVFTWDELEDFIIPYNDAELDMLVRMMNIVREDFHSVGIHLTSWHGPGAIASQVLRKYEIDQHKAKADTTPKEVLNASQYAYAGGRFEHFKLGHHPNQVWEYDIRSAYPAAIAQLPSLSEGVWEYVESFEPDTFGVFYIDYHAERGQEDKPQPLFCRSSDGYISFPKQVTGWYWGPEASLVPGHVQYGWVFRPSFTGRPFEFIRLLYEQRKTYKQEGNPTERALKLILNSIYGKLAQLVGGRQDGPPQWHQLEWAGWITSYTRAMIYKAILLNPDAIIACETDAVFSTEPLDLYLGDGLGEWEETTFNSITYLQSGFYYATTPNNEVICRYRGMDRDRETKQPAGLPYRTVLDHLRFGREQDDWRTPALSSTSTRFINIGLGLRTNATFRSWEKASKTISVDQRPRKSKRHHLGRTCPQCAQGYNLSDCLHPMIIGGYEGESYPHPLPWVIGEHDDIFELEGISPETMKEILRWEG